MMLPSLLRGPIHAAQVRAAREASGWTVEEFAGAMRVTPAEVAAWEAGARPSREQAAWIRWHAAMAERDRAYGPGGIEPCEWMRAYPERMRAATRRGAHRSDLPWSDLRAHTGVCPACQRAAEMDAALPAIPPEPVGNDVLELWKHADQLPAWKGTAVRIGGTAILFAAAALVRWLYDPHGDSKSAEMLIKLFGAVAGYLLTDRLLRPVARTHPYFTWIVRVSAMAYGVFIAAGVLAEGDRLADPSLWILTGIVSLVLGAVAGHMAADRYAETVPEPAEA